MTDEYSTDTEHVDDTTREAHMNTEEAAGCPVDFGRISHPTEGVSGVRRADDGWCVLVDVLEVPRIPDTTSLLAVYEVQLDNEGELKEYRRVRRYRRGAADE